MDTRKTIESLLDSLMMPACIVAPDRSLEYCNCDFLELAGISAGDIGPGTKVDQCLQLSVFRDYDDPVRKAMENRKNIRLREVHGTGANGERLTLCISVIPLSLVGENGQSVALAFSDLTQVADAHRKYEDIYETEKVEREKLAEFNARLNDLVKVKTKELQKAHAELDKELEIAGTVQSGLMPTELPDLLSMRIASAYIPAGKVGGDLYDIILTKDRKVAVVIFDVSGHGVPSALIGAMAKMLFAHHIEKGSTPAEIFTAVNSRLCGYVHTGHYLTAFLGIIDPSNNTMVYSLAGHVRPIVHNPQSGNTRFLKGNGIFVGHPALESLAKYEDNNVAFGRHDKLLLYTDGITEAMNDTGELYGSNRLSEAVEKNGGLDTEEFVSAIVSDSKAFRKGAALSDDFTLLCIEFGFSDEILHESGFTKTDLPAILTCSSDGEIEGVCSVILREMDLHGYPTQYFFRAHLCVHEILSNAVRHGNKSDKSKKTTVLYKVDLDKFSVSVIDEGDGFDTANLPDPLTPENIQKDYGRGLFIVHQYMDEVSFNEKGNRIRITKYLSRGAKNGDSSQ